VRVASAELFAAKLGLQDEAALRREACDDLGLCRTRSPELDFARLETIVDFHEHDRAFLDRL